MFRQVRDLCLFLFPKCLRVGRRGRCRGSREIGWRGPLLTPIADKGKLAAADQMRDLSSKRPSGRLYCLLSGGCWTAWALCWERLLYERTRRGVLVSIPSSGEKQQFSSDLNSKTVLILVSFVGTVRCARQWTVPDALEDERQG
jgi:hypothetical protein